MNSIFTGTGPRITVIGGGTGMSVILRGLKKITDNLAAVVTMADDGGSSGMLREDLGMLPPGDLRSCLLALADVEADFGELMNFRFTEGNMAGQNLGNLIIAGMADLAGSFEKGLEKMHSLMRINGRVIPVTIEEITLCARLEGGTIVRGESSIPKTVIAGEGRIESVYLEPEDAGTWRDAEEAIKEADIILIGPGSLYTSLIPNFLVKGINEALEESPAVKVYVNNVMTQKGETDGFTAADHLREIIKYMNGRLPDYMVVNNSIIPDESAERYKADGAVQVLLAPADREKLEAVGLKIIEADLIDISCGYIRHDADEVAAIVNRILGIYDDRELCYED